MFALSRSSLKEGEGSIARLEMRLDQYEIHMARSGSCLAFGDEAHI